VNDSFHNELRLKNFTIDIFDHDPRELGNFPNVSGEVCYYQRSSLPGGMYNFTCPKPILGRYVRLIIR
ncbi:fucolectin, partial [Biomphalaria glabrata]